MDAVLVPTKDFVVVKAAGMSDIGEGRDAIVRGVGAESCCRHCESYGHVEMRLVAIVPAEMSRERIRHRVAPRAVASAVEASVGVSE